MTLLFVMNGKIHPSSDDTSQFDSTSFSFSLVSLRFSWQAPSISSLQRISVWMLSLQQQSDLRRNALWNQMRKTRRMWRTLPPQANEGSPRSDDRPTKSHTVFLSFYFSTLRRHHAGSEGFYALFGIEHLELCNHNWVD